MTQTEFDALQRDLEDELAVCLTAFFNRRGLAYDHAAYIASWLKVLKDEKRAIFTAASHAQKAADFLHGLQAKYTDSEERAAV